ncbi:hypothetical protein PS15m_011401 [Mucor circinelloides]
MSDIWFNGPIAEAISLVAEKQCVFLVYIHDESEKTNTLNGTLKNEQVTKAIRENTVAVAMEKASENAALFGQYYPIQTVPILYFIKQGTIKDFGIETITSQEIIDKINAVNQISTVPVQQPVSTSAPVAAPATPIPAPQPPTNGTSSTSDAASASKTVKKDEQNDEIRSKKAEMQKQLEQVRKERAEREQQDAKDREIKRRQEAKTLQEAQQSRVDKENKIYFEKIKKERQEDEAHRKRVREQIARDRAEKIAQRNAEKQRQNSTASTALATEEGASSSSLSNSNNHAYSNLNIRQLDGSNIRHQFEAVSTLSEVRNWIKENRTEDAKKPYKLSSQFPTRLFTDADDDRTLKELNLCPSATIIMKPLKVGSSSARSVISGNNGGVTGYVYSAFDLIYGFVIAVINLLTGILATLFPTNGMALNNVPTSQHQQPLIPNMRGGQRLGGESVSAESSATPSSSAAQKRNPYATRVNTLHDEDDSEDEDKRSTYNGNSVNHE